MADASQVFTPIFPAQNGGSTPGIFNCALGPSIVRRILLVFPAGCGGLVGVRIEAGAGYAFPNQPNQYMLFDDYTYELSVDNQVDSGQWRLVGFNRDFIDHEILTVFEYDYLRGQAQQNASSQPIAL